MLVADDLDWPFFPLRHAAACCPLLSVQTNTFNEFRAGFRRSKKEFGRIIVCGLIRFEIDLRVFRLCCSFPRNSKR